MGRKKIIFSGAGRLLAGILAALLVGWCFPPALAQENTIVEYDQLRQLLLEGNIHLKKANDSYETTKKNYQDLMEQMRQEQEYMKFLAEKYEGTEDEMSYTASAAMLGAQAGRLSRQIEAMNRKTRTLTVEENTDSYTMAAQSVMNSYNQMVLNAAAREKSVQAAQASYEAVMKKQSSGAATAADVMDAANRLSQQQNLLSSSRQQVSQLRFRLLSMLGLPDDGTVAIGTIPEPDLSEVDGVNYEEDKTRAVNNDSQVQSVRHSRAGTTAEIARKSKEEAEAVGSAEAEFLSVYQQLREARLQYQASADAYESARAGYESLQLKKQAGMLSQVDYLEGEADYLQAVADRGGAAMNLVQALENYRWAVKGTEEMRQ